MNKIAFFLAGLGLAMAGPDVSANEAEPPGRMGSAMTKPGIDLSPEPGGAITGTVRSMSSKARLEGWLDVWDARGNHRGTVTTDAAGHYRVGGLDSGRYFVSTRDVKSGDRLTRYSDLLYVGIPCASGACDVTRGTPVQVRLGVTTPRIDFALTPVAEPACVPSATVLCLNDDRFKVEAQWRDYVGQSDAGRGVNLTDNAGAFWFFDSSNLELVVKVLDGCFDPFDAFWVFASGLTDVEVDLTVTDTATGETRTYNNALGTPFVPIQDLGAFETCDVAAVLQAAEPFTAASGELERRPAERPELGQSALATEPSDMRDQKPDPGSFPKVCKDNATTLCLSDGRFAVTADWDTGRRVGQGQAIRLNGAAGAFWFFTPDNVELVIKVLDACDLEPFNTYWLFTAGLTDVKVTLRVVDTETLEVREWVNPLDTAFQPSRETGAVMACQ